MLNRTTKCTRVRRNRSW